MKFTRVLVLGIALVAGAAAAFLALSRRTLETWRWEGKGPRWIRFSLGAVRYRRADLIDFIQAHEAVEPADKQA